MSLTISARSGVILRIFFGASMRIRGTRTQDFCQDSCNVEPT